MKPEPEPSGNLRPPGPPRPPTQGISAGGADDGPEKSRQKREATVIINLPPKPTAAVVYAVPEVASPRKKIMNKQVRYWLGLFCLILALLFLATLLPGLFMPHVLGFYKVGDAFMWALMGCLLCFLPDSQYQVRLSRRVLRLAVGAILAGAGFFLTVMALRGVWPGNAEERFRFYECIGVGPMMFFSGVSLCFDSREDG